MADPISVESLDAFARLSMLRDAVRCIAPDDEELAVIDGMLEQLRSQPYTLALVGEFNRGKSSLLNALLGMPILPMDVTPTTAVVNRVVYSGEPYALLIRRDGGRESIPMDALRARVTKLDTESASASARIKEVVIGYPTAFCRENISILDTPGLNESEEMNETTLRAARQSDAVIYALHALFPFSQTEAAAVCATLKNSSVRHVMFTVGFIDMVDERDRERLLCVFRERVPQMTCSQIDADDAYSPEEKERQKAIIQNSAVLGISAKKALDYFVTGNAADLRLSGIEAYKKELMTRLNANKEALTRQRVLPYLERAAATYHGAANRQLTKLDRRIAQTRSDIDRLHAVLETLPAYRQDRVWVCAVRLAGHIGTPDALCKELQGLILTSMENDFPQAGEVCPSAAGLWGQLKKKAKETGFYRENDDPEKRRLDAAREAARNTVLKEWLPVADKYAKEVLARVYGEAQAKRKELEALFASAYESLTPRAANKECAGDGGGPARIVFLTDELLSQVKLLPIEPELPLGTVEKVAQRGARRFAGRYLDLLQNRMISLADGLLPFKAGFLRECSSQLALLETEVDALVQKRAALDAQYKAIGNMFFAENDHGAEPSFQPAGGAERQNGQDTNESIYGTGDKHGHCGLQANHHGADAGPG